jgi:hypothetical protein
MYEFNVVGNMSEPLADTTISLWSWGIREAQRRVAARSSEKL